MKRQVGFTLIELLVVISIIALVIAILLPVMSSARDEAQAVACGSHQRQFAIGFSAYSQDYDNYMPSVGDNYLSPTVFWTTRSLPYFSGVNEATHNQVGQTFFRDPAREPHNPGQNENYTYGLNYHIVSGWDNLFYSDGRVMRVDDLKSSVYVLSDAKGDLPWTLWPGSPNWPLTADVDGDGILDTTTAASATYSPFNGLVFPHPGDTSYFTIVDGSALRLEVSAWASNRREMWGELK